MVGKIRITFLMAFLLTALFNVSISAQEVSFWLDMESLNLQKGVSANIVVHLTNAQGAQILNIEGLEEFDILSQSQSTTMSMVNGVTTLQERQHYIVMPKTAGQFEIKANIHFDNMRYETNALQVTVSEGSSGTDEPARDVFIETVLSHTDSYLGEKVILTYELYTRFNVDGFGFLENITIDGMLVNEIPSNQLGAEFIFLDGERYIKYEASQFILDPIRAGTYTIPSFNFQVNVVTGDSMGGFFRSSTPVYLQTEGKELTVRPLPSEGRPSDFSGIVGEFRVDGRYSRTELDYGDSFILYATVAGRGNLDGLTSLAGRINGLTVYEIIRNMTETVEDNQYYVNKEFELILVPERPGTLEIPPISISYFNPVTGRYETAEIPGTLIEVLGDMTHFNNNIGNHSQFSPFETIIINQVNYTDANENYFTIQLRRGTVYGILVGVAVLFVFAAILIWFIKTNKKSDPELKSLYKQLLGAKDINEIYSLFNAMIKHCYNLSLKANSQSIVRNSLPDSRIVAITTEIMDYMESSNAKDEKGSVHLKEKVINVYKLINQRQ